MVKNRVRCDFAEMIESDMIIPIIPLKKKELARRKIRWDELINSSSESSLNDGVLIQQQRNKGITED